MVSGEVISQAPGGINSLWTIIYFLATLWSVSMYLLNKRINQVLELREENRLLVEKINYLENKLEMCH